MIVDAIYHGLNQIRRVYRGSQLIFQGNKPIQFHITEDGKLIVVGALSALPFEDGLYLDCYPDVEWDYPVLENGVLTITQAHTATHNGITLEVG